MSPPAKRARASPAQESSAEERNEQFQRGVLNMMQLHPQANVLAERVFERMPLEGFVDAKNVLLPKNGHGYDSLLSFGNCEVILNKFEKEEPILRPLRKEYECATETLPALSGVSEILSRLWNIKYNENMKSKNQIKIDDDDPIFWKRLKFDFSSNFLVTTMRLYDDSVFDENQRETKSLNGEKLSPLNVHIEANTNIGILGAAYSSYLFVYYLSRGDPNIVKPLLVRTIELADLEYHYFLNDEMNFCVCGNFLAVPKKWRRQTGLMRCEYSFDIEFYDMEKSRKDEPDLIYTLEKLKALGWCNDTIARFDFEDSDDDEEEDEYEYELKLIFFSENCFVCSRDNGDGNFAVEVHEISSKGCLLLKKIELHTDPERPFDNLYIESIGSSTWNFYISSKRSRETQIVFFNKRKNKMTTRIEKEPIPDTTSNLPPNVHYPIYGELDRAVKRVKSKIKNEKNVYGHVRFCEQRDDGTDNWTSYIKFYA